MLRILCITHCLPYPSTTGANQRTALLLRALSEFGTTDLIHVCRFGPRPHPAVAEECRVRFNLIATIEPVNRGLYKPWKFVRFVRPELVDRLANVLGTQTITYRADPHVSRAVRKAMQANKYDVIIGRPLFTAAMADVLENMAGIPVLIDLDDVDHIVARENTNRSTPWLKRIVFSMRRPQIERTVPPLLDAASHLWVCAAVDARELGQRKCSILPNIPYSDPDQPIEPCPPRNESKEILVVGTFNYMPNAEGVENFLMRCWPSIRRAVPNATLRIVGGGLSNATSKRWSAVPGVEILGFVANLREEYQRSAFSIVPIQRGGGTKIKALECFAFGRTCVVSPHGHRGIESVLRHNESLWRGNDDREFIEGCIQLLTDIKMRNVLAQHGHRLVSEEYSFKRFRDVIGVALGELARNKPPNLWPAQI